MLEENNSSSEPGADFLSKLNASLKDGLSKVTEAVQMNFSVDAILGAIKEVDEASLNIVKSFGQARENMVVMKQSMTAAVTDVTLLGGGFEDIAEIQKDVAESLGRNLILVESSYKTLYAAAEVTGQSAKFIVTNFKDAGYSAYQAADGMKEVVDVARSMGVNAKAVSGEVLENMSALNKFNFEGGVQGLAKMASQASLLRIDMKETLDLSLELFSPEKAIDLAASMQRLGVANSELLDPLRLMDMAQNDPAELQNQISKMTEQFVQMNEKGQFEIMPGARRQLMEISKELNIPYEQLTKMGIATKELDQKLSQINFAGFQFSEEQKNLIANMSEMGTDGKFKIQVEGEGEMDLEKAMVKFQENPKLLEALEKSAQPKTMEDLAAEQLTVSKSMEASLKSLVKTPYAIAGQKVAQDAYTAPASIMREGANVMNVEALSIKNIGKAFQGGTEDVLKSIDSIIKGQGSMSELADILTKQGEKLKSAGSDAGTQIIEKYDESVKRLSESNNTFIDIMMDGAKKLKEVFLKVENLGGNQKNTEVKVEDFVIKTLPQDKLVMAGGTNLGGNQEMTSNETKRMDVNMNLNITAPPNIDTAQLVLALENTNVKEAMVKAVSMGRYNNGLTAPTSNNVKLLESMANGVT